MSTMYRRFAAEGINLKALNQALQTLTEEARAYELAGLQTELADLEAAGPDYPTEPVGWDFGETPEESDDWAEAQHRQEVLQLLAGIDHVKGLEIYLYPGVRAETAEALGVPVTPTFHAAFDLVVGRW